MLLRTAFLARLVMGRALRVTAILTLFSLINACADKSDVKIIRIGHTLDTKHSVHQALIQLGERLSRYSNGRMVVKIYPVGQLGSERQMVELLQIGSLAMTKVSAATLEGFSEDMKLYGLPYVFSSKEQRFQVLNGDIGHDILASLNGAHLVGLGYMDAGSRSFYTCDKAVNSPEDVVGKNIRVMNSQNAVNMIGHFGGAGTPLSWGELYAALQQGVVDGAENNPPSYFTSRHYEVCKFYTLNEHTSIPDVVVASKHIFDSLSEEEQKWLIKATDDAVNLQIALWDEAEQDALKKLDAAGVTIAYPDKAPFIEAVKPMHLQHKNDVIGAYLSRINQSQIAGPKE